MILHINYWHKTAAGEASNIVKVTSDNPVELHRMAQKEYFSKCTAYASDSSVIDYAVTILNPQTGERGLHHAYYTPDQPASPEPTES